MEFTQAHGDCNRAGDSGGEEKAVTFSPISFSLSLELLPDTTVRNAAFGLLTSNEVECFAHKTPTRSQSPQRDTRSAEQHHPPRETGHALALRSPVSPPNPPRCKPQSRDARDL